MEYSFKYNEEHPGKIFQRKETIEASDENDAWDKLLGNKEAMWLVDDQSRADFKIKKGVDFISIHDKTGDLIVEYNNIEISKII